MYFSCLEAAEIWTMQSHTGVERGRLCSLFPVSELVNMYFPGEKETGIERLAMRINLTSANDFN